MPNESSRDRLVAIVEVEQKDRVVCQELGCGHGVYKRIHVVSSEGGLTVLGSTCYAKRYGAADALGGPSYGDGSGRRLTPEERALLTNNTAELLARFEAEAQALRDAEEVARYEAAAAAKAAVERRKQIAASTHAPRSRATSAISYGHASPWPWAKPLASMAYFQLKDGTSWVRIQHHDGRQMLAPHPVFDGWDEALPKSVGQADYSLGALVVNDIIPALATLRRMVAWERIDSWRDIGPSAGRKRYP